MVKKGEKAQGYLYLVALHKIASIYHLLSSEKYFDNQDCPIKKLRKVCVHSGEQLKFSSPGISAFLPDLSLENSSIFSVSRT